MNSKTPSISVLVAPRENFSCLVHPPLGTLERWLESPLAYEYPTEWKQKRDKARFEVLSEACITNYHLAQVRGEGFDADQELPKRRDFRISKPWIVTGHQPEFIHPGVWLKNYFTARLAEENDAYSLNLIVEHDQLKHPEIKYPLLNKASGSISELKHFFSSDSSTTTWEFAKGKSTTETAEFLDFMRQATSNYPEKSLLAELTLEQVDQYRWGTITLSEWMTSLRKAAEVRLDFGNNELPTGPCCDTDSFLEFFLEIVVRHQEFHQIYNQNLARYRTENNLKNPAQPVPDLSLTDGWYELPFWLVNEKKKFREPIYLKIENEHYCIKGLSTGIINCPLEHKTLTGLLVKFKPQLYQSDCRIRPRALTLTMFARMFLADLFVHGLGGGKYDQITDHIIRKFYGLEPTPFAVVTGTCFLPFHKQNIKSLKQLQQERAQLQHELRKIKLQPETCLQENMNPEFNSIIKEIDTLKKMLLDRQQAPQIRLTKQLRANNKKCYQPAYLKLKLLRSQLVHTVQNKIEECQIRLNQIDLELKEQKLMSNREYPAFLYPSKTLLKFFEQPFMGE